MLSAAFDLTGGGKMGSNWKREERTDTSNHAPLLICKLCVDVDEVLNADAGAGGSLKVMGRRLNERYGDLSPIGFTR